MFELDKIDYGKNEGGLARQPQNGSCGDDTDGEHQEEEYQQEL